jgi:hypothetical protein
MDFEAAGEKRKMQISELEEWREKAYHSSKLYKEKKPRDDMIRESRRSLHPEIRYYFLILGSNFSAWKIMEQMERTIYGGKCVIAWSGYSTHRRRYVI